MTHDADRELLELAAKAAGIYCCWSDHFNCCLTASHNSDGELEFDGGDWNPLADDGDALRLAVKLNMQIVITGKSDSLSVGITDARSTESGWMQAIHIKDPYEATRRAIVRAAAAIGETL